MMRKAWNRAAKRLNDLDLRSRIGHMVCPAHHICDAHFGVIDNAGHCVKHLPVRANKHRVRNRGRINRHIPDDPIGPLDALLIKLKAPVAPPLSAQRIFFRLG